jgi:hypothetical protein
MNAIKKLSIAVAICLVGISSISMAQEKSAASNNHHVIHVVLFKFSEQATPDQTGQLMAHIKSLKDKILGIEAMSFGKNFSERSKGYTDAVTITFTDQAALLNFIKHPLHQELIKDFIKPILADMIVVDYADAANQ